MSEKIVQLNEEIIKGQLKELVRGSVEETLNELLEKEAESLTQVVSRFMRKFDSGIWQKSITGGASAPPLGYVWTAGAQRVKGGGGRLSCP